jgi:YVTN family beta-propeller protein
MRRAGTVAVVVATVTAVAGGSAVAAGVLRAGPQGDGTAVTSGGYRVTPAGSQTTVGERPYHTALSPDGRTLLVSNDGQSTQSLQVVDVASHQVRQSLPYGPDPAPGANVAEALFYGVAYSHDGRHAYASAGGNNKIRVYDVRPDGQQLDERDPIALPVPAGTNPYPAGLAVAPDDRTLYVADQLGDALSVIDLPAGTVTTVPVGHNPLDVAVSPDGSKVYVSNQGASTVSVYQPASKSVVATAPVGTHPNAMAVDPRTGMVYVANGDADSVSVLDPDGIPRRTIDLAPYAGAPVGSNPDGVALSPAGNVLYVANAGNNDVVVVGLAEHAVNNADLAAPEPAPEDTAAARAGDNRHRDRVLGSIPTGWYPSSVTVATDGRQLLVTNAKGLGTGPNDKLDPPATQYPNPYRSPQNTPDQYAGAMSVGTLSAVRVPSDDKLATYTRQVARNDGFDERDKVRTAGYVGHVVPRRVGDASPIKHVIYVVKENRTYDQEFGSLGKGNGEPALNLFGEESAPNARALQRTFVTLDNFYADAEISAQGWNWVTGANANPYVEQTWEANYSARNRSTYDFEGGNPATAPNRTVTDSYLWDRLADKSISFRNYGFFKFGTKLNGAGVAGSYVDPRLAANTDPRYNGYDLAVPDSVDPAASYDYSTGKGPRIGEWRTEFDSYVRDGNLPTVELVRLPNDHTAGTKVDSPTPRAYVADNDYALGQLVDAVSHSPYWASTAIFVTEDDAQNGPDHVDAHRTISQVISPYTQTGRVDSAFYSTTSMLRTMELIAGITPLTQFDAYSLPMYGAFRDSPDLTPYAAIRPSQSLTEFNPVDAPLAEAVAAQDLSQEDKADEQVLNAAIWKSVRGAGSEPPAPQHRKVAAGTGKDEDG